MVSEVMLSGSKRVGPLLDTVLELSITQLEHLKNNRLVQMLECQQQRTDIFSKLAELCLGKYIKEPEVKEVMEKILAHDKELAINIEATVQEHKKTISTLQKGSAAIKAYSR